jgi:hypothetical protein
MGTSIEGGLQLTVPVYAEGVLFGDVPGNQPKQAIDEISATQQHRLGTKLIYADGRVFRYAKNGGTALSKALMTTSEALNGRSTEELQSTYGTAAEIGDLEFDVDVTTGGTWVENEYSEGFLVVNKATGIGDMYKILANKINASDDTLMRIRLQEPLRTALDATSEITFVKSPWRDVDVMPTTAEGTPAGIPLVTVTASYYCWLQTGGYAACIVDTSETLVKGGPAGYPGTPNVAGACGPIGADTDQQWGVAVYIATEAEAAILDLKLDS